MSTAVSRPLRHKATRVGVRAGAAGLRHVTALAVGGSRPHGRRSSQYFHLCCGCGAQKLRNRCVVCDNRVSPRPASRLDREHLQGELERASSGYTPLRKSTRAIALIGGDDKHTLLADPHAQQPLVPPGDHLSASQEPENITERWAANGEEEQIARSGDRRGREAAERAQTSQRMRRRT